MSRVWTAGRGSRNGVAGWVAYAIVDDIEHGAASDPVFDERSDAVMFARAANANGGDDDCGACDTMRERAL